MVTFPNWQPSQRGPTDNLPFGTGFSVLSNVYFLYIDNVNHILLPPYFQFTKKRLPCPKFANSSILTKVYSISPHWLSESEL